MDNRQAQRGSFTLRVLWLTLPLVLALTLSTGTAFAQQGAQTGGAPPSAAGSSQEFAVRGQREAREIKYGDWRKVCFKTSGAGAVCRTTISGTWQTGQSAVRIDLIEKEGENVARLQLFLPVGLYLQAGVKVTIDQGSAYRIPYVWCLTNTCIAADRAEHTLIKEMEAGQKLLLEVVDSSVLTVSTSLPVNQFAAVRRGPASQIFDQAIDE